MSDRNRNNEFDFDDDFFNDDKDSPMSGDELPEGFGEDIDDDMPVIEGAEDERRGGNRTFVILAALMILLFLCGLGLVLFLILRPTEPTPFELTSTAIANQNATTVALGLLTATQNQIFAFETQTREAITNTPTPSPSPTTPPEPTATPTLDATFLAATAFAIETQDAINAQATGAALTATAIALQPELTRNAEQTRMAIEAQGTQDALNAAATLTAAVGTPIAQVPTQPAEISSFQQTATAIAAGFLTATAQAAGPVEGPTQEGGFGPIVRPTALPDTGLFDDVIGGGRDGIGILALAVIGLVGVIVVSRRLRARTPVVAAEKTDGT
jgi:cytoskeletal protein RodZ